MRHQWILVLGLGSSAAAQGVTVRGIAYDSLHSRRLSGAFITIAGTNKSAISDSGGNFRIDGVARGTYRVLMQHDALDALGISAAGAKAVVTDGREMVMVAIPSFASMWKTACGTPAPAADTGFIFGTVRIPSNIARSATTVTASWINIVERPGALPAQKQAQLEVEADSSGAFALCGVPTSTGLTIRATMGPALALPIDIPPMDRERILRQDLTIVAAPGRPKSH